VEVFNDVLIAQGAEPGHHKADNEEDQDCVDEAFTCGSNVVNSVEIVAVGHIVA